MPANILILLGICKFFIRFFHLLCLYYSSTIPLLYLYKLNKRSLSSNKGTLFCNKGTLLVNKRLLFPSDHNTAGSVFIPKVGMFYSQAGNISFPRWE